MAVKVPNHLYFEHYKRETLTLFVLTQLLGGALAGVTAIFAWQAFSTTPLLALGLSVVVLVIWNVVVAFFLFAFASEPLRILAQAIAHVSKDPVVTPPPSLDAPQYERSGLKALVQTVYGLAVNGTAEPQTPPSNNADMAFEHLADDLPCGLIALNANGGIMYANKLAPAKATPDGGRGLTLLFDQKDTLHSWLADCEANKVRDTRVWQRVADKLPGESGRRIFDIVAYYQKDNPAGVAAIVVAVDRTYAYKTDEDDMDFIALAAHELRGPITIIRGYLDVIKQELGERLDADQKLLFDRLQVSSERLAGYVTNILNVSRYDRKQFTMHRQEASLAGIIQSVAPDLSLRASTQHRKLTFSIPPDLPTVAADRSSLGEVITNLIDNAIKYSHDGGEVLITAAPKDDRVEVTVQDHGIGMPESVVGGLFNKFYRSHRSRQSVGGTGLGLYICKAIVEAHGGTIWVRSVEGQGSTFGFSIPTFASVANKLQSGDNLNNDIVQRPEGWIKNHAMYRR